jgi:hypothetical protein
MCCNKKEKEKKKVMARKEREIQQKGKCAHIWDAPQ